MLMEPSGKFPSQTGNEKRSAHTAECEIARRFLNGISGGNPSGMNPFADRLNAQWTGQKTEIFFIPEYYNHNSADIWLEEQGIHETSEGLHDDFAVTATMLAVDSDSVRTKERITADRFRINGI